MTEHNEKSTSDWQKLRALGRGEYLALTVSLISLPIVGVLLKYRGFKQTEKLLSSVSRRSTDATVDLPRVQRISRMVSVAANRGLYRPKCLVQAITLWWILGLIGLASTIRLGLYKLGDVVEAHAWVLYQGEIVLGELSDLDDYTPLLDVNFDRE